MKQQQAAIFGILSCALLAAEGEAFSTTAPQTQSLRQKIASSSSSSALNLVPDQGNQLAAAYNAAHSDDDEMNNNNNNNNKKITQEVSASETTAPIEANHNNDGVDESSHWRAIAASKSFLTRIFHKPSGNSKHTPGVVEGDLDHSNINNNNKNKNEDVVYYPMVGFTYFEGIENALPTTSHQSCIMTTKSQKEEEVYGWFSSSCKLDFFSEDVCHTPIVAVSPEEETEALM